MTTSHEIHIPGLDIQDIGLREIAELRRRIDALRLKPFQHPMGGNLLPEGRPLSVEACQNASKSMLCWQTYAHGDYEKWWAGNVAQLYADGLAHLANGEWSDALHCFHWCREGLTFAEEEQATT